MKTLLSAPSGAAIAFGLVLCGPIRAQFTTLEEFGNAAGTTPPASFTQNAGTITVAGGGADFWGTSDNGVFLWDNTGTQTTTGDFTATVRHVSTSDPAPEWGRSGIMARATQTPGAPAATDAHWLVHRKSNGQFVTGRRPTAGAETRRATDIDNPGVNFNSDANERSFQTGSVLTTPFYLAAGRQGDRMYSGYALDLNGSPGRWLQHWSTDSVDAIGGLQGDAEVIVGLAQQSHPQTGGGAATGGVNVATFDQWSYTGAFVPSKFGPPSGPTTWQLAGSASADASTGAVSGSAYVREGGVATGEPLEWTVRAYKANSFFPAFGLDGSRKDPKLMEVADLVPAANFRRSAGNPGLTADIYLAGNAGNFDALNAIAQGPPEGTAIIPNIHWGHPDTGVGYPSNGMGGNLFQDAVPSFVSEGDGQEDYGVNLTGEIFIPADADRRGFGALGEFIVFKDGVDDFCYLEIDGVVLINDNDWTGNFSVDNGGGNISMLDVSDAKYNDGEWVSFRMMMWEGGGGDTCSLYWSAYDTNNTFGVAQIPGSLGSTFVPALGVAGAKKHAPANPVSDLVPPENLRHISGGNPVPGLKADIYLRNNEGNLGAWNTIVNNNDPDGTAILPNVFWGNGNPPYPDNGMGGNLFADAVPGSFQGNQESYGVNMTGEILIPSDATRAALDFVGGHNYVAFEDGVDDFCYLEIDGRALINDNDWTGAQSSGPDQNGGGHVSLLDVSDPKYDDGEWVQIRMVMWEGGGGDTAALYWSALDASSYPVSVLPGRYGADAGPLTGFTQVGTQTTTDNFGGISLPGGSWILELTLQNTGTSFSSYSQVEVNAPAAGPSITSYSYDPATTTLNLSFTSTAGTNYALEYSTGLQPAGAPTSVDKWNVVPGYGSIAGQAGTTAIVPLNTGSLVSPGGLLPNNTKSYFRIRRL